MWAPRDANVLATACEDRALRWWDLRARRAVAEVVLDGAVGTCELDRGGADAGGAILSVAAGNAVYFFDAERPGALVKKVATPYQIASVACNAAARRFITGSPGDTWVRVWDLDEEKEVGKSGARSGIRWLMGSQRSGRAIMVRSGRASFRRMGSCTLRGARMGRSSFGSSPAGRTGCGDECW